MRKIALAATALAVGLSCLQAPVAAFADAPSAASVTTAGTTLQRQLDALLPQSGLTADKQQQIRELAAQIPQSVLDKAAALRATGPGSGTTFAEIANSVIDPAGSVCGSTPMRDWLGAQVKDIDPMIMLFAHMIYLDALPTYDALIYGTSSKSNVFGGTVQHSRQLTSTFKGLQRFWNIPTDISLVPMTSDVFSSVEATAHAYGILTSDPKLAMAMAQLAHLVLDLEPAFQQGKNPIFTFNAYAFDPQGDPEYTSRGVGKKILIGDGILAGLDAVGLSDVGPRAVLSHEFGHQVQYADHLLDGATDTPEASRRTELMADAFGTYYLTHSRGEAINAKRVLDDENTFYNVGDCSVSVPGHHGTPNQRFRSAAWAVSVVNSQPNQGHQVDGITFGKLFDAELPVLVAPDAP